MPVKIVLLNGPPRCGKDTAAGFLCDRLRGIEHKCADPLRNAVPAMFGMALTDWRHAYLHAKETPHPALQNLSPRQAMIWLSEQVMKPTFGEDIFGRIATTALRARLAVYDGANPLVLISDSGFESEIVPMAEAFGAENMLLLRIQRPGHTFAGDSRSFIRPLPGMDCVEVFNDGSLLDFEHALVAEVQSWLRRSAV